MRRPSLISLALFGHLAAHSVKPSALLVHAAVQQECLPYQTETLVSITFDDYPAEISWKITDNWNDSVVCSRDFANEGLGSGETEEDTCCLDHRYWEENPVNKEDRSSDDSMDDRRSNSPAVSIPLPYQIPTEMACAAHTAKDGLQSASVAKSWSTADRNRQLPLVRRHQANSASVVVYRRRRFEELVQSMTRALGDNRLNWEIEFEIRFGNIYDWLNMGINNDDAPLCWTLVSVAQFIAESNDKFG